MQSQSDLAVTLSDAGHHLGPARVTDFEGGQPTLAFNAQSIGATCAVPGYHPAVGDEVLVIGNHHGAFYIIGVLRTASGVTRFTAEHGDLELVATHGKARCIATEGIELHSPAIVEARGGLGVVLSALGRAGRLLPRLSLGPTRSELRNTELHFAAESIHQHSELHHTETRAWGLSAERVEARTETAALSANTLSTRLRNAYTRVAELWQLTAGRTRSLVRGTSHHKAERIYSKAERDVKLKADQINLG
ncbi:DUF3540 domain-containing protein [Arhodomonas sp. SL1]|uniref:DUF3540 domain-containing protein n=1 Tax=Arhodomonas sp. SL1 TaxID=3425691 RepID=UPI003F88359D